MTSETNEWLKLKVPEYSYLSEDEREEIYDFSFLWGLFESRLFNCDCNVRKIRQLVNNLAVRNTGLDGIYLAPYVYYLRNRYYVDGSLTNHYHNLHVERSGNPEEVLEMLRREDCTESVKLIGCLVVVLRLRNNLFHGEKWRYQLSGQFDNFRQANIFLRNLMDYS